MVSPLVSIHIQQSQQKGKNTIFPSAFRLCLLRYNMCLTPSVVGLNSVSMLVLVAHSLRVLEGYPLSTKCLEFFFSHPLICPIGGHQHHDIVLLFNIEYTQRKNSKLTTKCVHSPNTHGLPHYHD